MHCTNTFKYFDSLNFLSSNSIEVKFTFHPFTVDKIRTSQDLGPMLSAEPRSLYVNHCLFNREKNIPLQERSAVNYVDDYCEWRDVISTVSYSSCSDFDFDATWQKIRYNFRYNFRYNSDTILVCKIIDNWLIEMWIVKNR